MCFHRFAKYRSVALKKKVSAVWIENEIAPEALSQLDVEHFKVKVFVGANQNKIPFETTAALHRMGDKAEYVKIAGNGSNAVSRLISS